MGYIKFDYIQIWSALHWLLVVYRVQIKLLLVYKAAKNQAPEYIKELLFTHSISAGRIRSCDEGFVTAPKTNHKTGLS